MFLRTINTGFGNNQKHTYSLVYTGWCDSDFAADGKGWTTRNDEKGYMKPIGNVLDSQRSGHYHALDRSFVRSRIVLFVSLLFALPVDT